MGNINVGSLTGSVNLTNYTSSNRPSNPTEGQMIYNSDTKAVEYWNGLRWSSIGSGSWSIVASGGTVSDVGPYRVHTFTTDDTFTVTSASTDSWIEVFLVGGGGGGCMWGGGGGGGGGVTYAAKYPITAGTYSITVGNGGDGQPPGTPGAGAGSYGSRGGNSTFGPQGGAVTLSAIGGGGGPGYNSTPSNTDQYQYIDGGCGGGGRENTYGGGGKGYPQRTYTPVGTVGDVQFFGNPGGNEGGSGNSGGGGGGAGEPGYHGNSGSTGGDGLVWNMDGTNRYYAAGGGGGRTSGTSSGGLGGGGGGNSGTSNGGDATGYGSGGGSLGVQNANYQTKRGGNGSAGIVFVRYLRAEPTIKEFTTPGTYTWVAPAGVTSVSALIVAGGGGGAGSNTTGSGPRGGGGAGGLYWEPGITVTPGNSYSITVGLGGQGGYGSGENNAANGQNSSAFGFTAIGGGGGGTYVSATVQGGSGGCGGGTAYVTGSNRNTGTNYQGYDGGCGMQHDNQGGSGGGGAGGAGYDNRSYHPNGYARSADHGGDGGQGKLIAISGVARYYACGGGAGGYPAGTAGSFGLGGSYNALGNNGMHGNGTPVGGPDGTGSGGGGGGSGADGSNGGCGCVVLCYIEPQ